MELISVLLRLLLSDCKSVPGCSGHVQERGTEGFYETRRQLPVMESKLSLLPHDNFHCRDGRPGEWPVQWWHGWHGDIQLPTPSSHCIPLCTVALSWQVANRIESTTGHQEWELLFAETPVYLYDRLITSLEDTNWLKWLIDRETVVDYSEGTGCSQVCYQKLKIKSLGRYIDCDKAAYQQATLGAIALNYCSIQLDLTSACVCVFVCVSEFPCPNRKPDGTVTKRGNDEEGEPRLGCQVQVRSLRKSLTLWDICLFVLLFSRECVQITGWLSQLTLGAVSGVDISEKATIWSK